MNTAATFILAASLIVSAPPALGQPSLYTASSKAQGAPFDISVTETEREEARSLLLIPGFHTRTAPASRWLMCAYTDLTMKRGFTHWTVMYPAEGSEVVVIGFSNSPNASPKDLLGPEYVTERVVGKDMTPVESLIRFCGLRR